MSLDVAQQVGTKIDGQNSKNKQPTIVFIYFPNFSSSRCFYLFYFFNYIFIFFSKQGNTVWKHKKFQPEQSKDLIYKNSGTFSEKYATTLELEISHLESEF
jgi:hypothetical protein